MAARTVVHDEDGMPAYEGQAILRVSCGNGAFCHSAAATGDARFGAPAGLDFDMGLASINAAFNPEGTTRLARGQANTAEWRSAIMDEIEAGRMPPGGPATVAAQGGTPHYRHSDARRVAGLGAVDGREAMRNWLSCGAPVVERTEAHAMGGDVGAVVPRGPSEPPLPTFTSIYERVLGPRCGASCHGPGQPDLLAASQLDLSDQAGAYAALVGVAAGGVDCLGVAPARVTAGDPAASLLVTKLDGTSLCGDPMPQSIALLPADVVAPIRQWVVLGAAND